MRYELPIVSFISAILVLIPLPLHWRARNIGTLSMIFWLGSLSVFRGINSIIWAGNTINHAPVWCDIITKLWTGANWGLPASTICLTRHLAQIASPDYKIPSKPEKRRRVIFDLVLCVVLPVIAMALHYVVQGHRFDIYEDFGCQPTFYMSVAALFIVFLPPIVFALVTLIYAGIALRWFVHRRPQFQAVLQSSNLGTGVTTTGYLRLIALAVTEIVLVTTVAIFFLVINLGGGLRPWVSWEFVHEDWLRVDRFDKVLLPQYFWDRYVAAWYMIPLSSIIFFAFFGFGQEVVSEYRGYWNFVKAKILRIKSKQQPALPVSERRRISAIDSTTSIPAVTKLHTETTGSRKSEEWDKPPASSIHTTSRPPSPSTDDNTSKATLDIESRG